MLATLPPLDEDLLVRLFRKGARVQWTSADFDWESPPALADRQRRALARLLSPVFLGEQTAMLGAASQMQEVARRGEATAQLYLASFIMDEARHFEALYRLYRHLGHDPVRVRELPDMLRYHHRLRQGDRLDWVWGILISDVFARHFYHWMARHRPDAVVGLMAQRIAVDEGRHQAFAEEYLRRALPQLDSSRRRALVAMKDELLRLMESMYRALREDADLLGLDARALLDAFLEDLEGRVRRLGLQDGRSAPPSAPTPSPTHRQPAASKEAPAGQKPGTAGSTLPPSAPAAGGSCGSCLLAVLCALRAGIAPRPPAPAPAPAG